MALEEAEISPVEREYANAVDMAAADPRKAMTRFEDLVLAGTRTCMSPVPGLCVVLTNNFSGASHIFQSYEHPMIFVLLQGHYSLHLRRSLCVDHIFAPFTSFDRGEPFFGVRG